jgi:4-diphosphocytidyl-2-C-methyl-D-erythritol kinase
VEGLSDRAVHLVAPAKLTLSLAVTGVRADGYHELSAEMVSVDLADELFVDPNGSGLHVEGVGECDVSRVPEGEDNLVRRALQKTGQRAGVHLCKRIPAAAGLGGGSSDAAAILRWANCLDPQIASTLGSDVSFCVQGGRARVEGVGERVTPLEFEPASFVLLLVPFGISTAACFAKFDELERGGDGRDPRNDLVAPALVLEPRLARWRERFAELTGQTPALAGSGSTWFVEGEWDELGLGDQTTLAIGAERARLVAARSVPRGWSGPTPED